MKAIALCQEGLEFITQQEVKELVGLDSKAEKGIVVFEASPEKIAKLCYMARSVKKIIALLDRFSIKKIEDLKRIEKIELGEWFDKETTFAARCTLAEGFEKLEIEEEVGGYVQQPVNLDSPDVTIITHIKDGMAYVGVDLTEMELDKRDYRIFPNPTTTKATTAYAMLKIADYKIGDVLLDTNCKDGTIAIEAAQLSTNFPVQYYTKEKLALLRLKPFQNFTKVFEKIDVGIGGSPTIYAYDGKMNNIKAAQKNAKIAGVNKLIKFSRTETEWLDTKFKEGEIDKIVTNMILPARNISEKEAQKLTEELIHQAEYVLKDKGMLVLITKTPDIIKEAAEKNKMKVQDKVMIQVGHEKLIIQKLRKDIKPKLTKDLNKKKTSKKQ